MFPVIVELFFLTYSYCKNTLWLFMTIFLFFLAPVNVKEQIEKANYCGLHILLHLCVPFLEEEGGGEDHVSCNYIYVGTHSICHSKFCLTCHIVNHYIGLNAV